MFQIILFHNNSFTYNLDVKEISLASMFGYAVNRSGKVQVVNKYEKRTLATDLRTPLRILYLCPFSWTFVPETAWAQVYNCQNYG